MRRWPRSIPDYKWPADLCGGVWRLWRAALAVVFHAAYLGGRLAATFRRRRPAVLVVRTDGLGDAILAEPMIRALADHFTNRDLHLWAPATTCQLYAAHPSIQQCISIPRGAKSGNLTYYKSLRLRAVMGWRLGRWRFDCAAYLAESPEPLGNWILASARAAEKWLNRGDTQNQFDWQQTNAAAAATWILEPAGRGHELDRNAAIARQWGSCIQGQIPRLYLPWNAMRSADELVNDWQRSARDVGGAALVGVVCRSAMSVKGYPMASWATAIARLWQEDRVVCALIGGVEDIDRIDELSGLLARITTERDFGGVPHLVMPYTLDVLGLAALIGRMDAMLTVDTAAAHLAVVQDVATVVLASSGHPGRFLPYPNPGRSIVLSHPVPCAGCHCRCQHPQAYCLTEITPDQIVAAARRLRDRGQFVPQEMPLRVAV